MVFLVCKLEKLSFVVGSWIIFGFDKIVFKWDIDVRNRIVLKIIVLKVFYNLWLNENY